MYEFYSNNFTRRRDIGYFPVDERRIRLLLILCKNSLERTKESLDQYYTIKSMVPEYFADRDPTTPALVRSMETTLVFYLFIYLFSVHA